MNDFLKYLTIEFVHFIEKPKKKRKKNVKSSTSIHWFGLIPVTLKVIANRLKKTA